MTSVSRNGLPTVMYEVCFALDVCLKLGLGGYRLFTSANKKRVCVRGTLFAYWQFLSAKFCDLSGRGNIMYFNFNTKKTM